MFSVFHHLHIYRAGKWPCFFFRQTFQTLALIETMAKQPLYLKMMKVCVFVKTN